ncbi:Cell morphogenesis protein PAG1 [Golovinomyces cichoracearum]|uniref:Cell morphogenesis protein PAG1 n=1 Tax=Golovinomyces cichoracearum TaxID=62708 RepID=A0A420IAI8_9PEZI|nr:Cell morphogenesis protein PAG1 [Golovinomyces cichoracearum]
MTPEVSKMISSPNDLTVDLKIIHAKSVTSRIASDLNSFSAQTSPSCLAIKVSQPDFKTLNGSPRVLSGNRLAESKAHNRQTSIVHGYQHSRNGSIASTSSSPLSPQMIAAAGGDTSLSFLSSSMTVSSDQLLAVGEDRSQSSNPSRHAKQQNGSSGRDFRFHPRLIKEDISFGSEFAFNALLTSFIALADEKLNQGIFGSSDPEPHIENICGPRIDLAFDHLLIALCHTARQKPKPLIDAIMLWRKSKSDAASEARAQLQQVEQTKISRTIKHRQVPRRNTEPLPSPLENASSGGNISLIAARQNNLVKVERRSTASIYILCRVLTEVLCQSTLAQITPEMEEKLENIIFGQLMLADIDQLKNSPIKLANWFLFSKLLGAMGEINFKSVGDRFIHDLEKLQSELVLKSLSNREIEGKIELTLGGMKHLRIKVHPEDAWDQSCDFMISMGRFFAKSHGYRLKYACCQALENLLLPVAAQADTELNLPKWSEVLGTIGPRLASMLVKPRHWSVAFPLTATLLCVSPIDSFTTQWLQLVLPLQPKLKDRFARPVCLLVISRLLWTYLYRVSTDPFNVISKKVEEVLKLILPAGRRTYLMTDPSSADPLIQIIRTIGFKHQEFCFRAVIFPLINVDLFNSSREPKIEQFEPEKMVIGIRAFVAIISDLEKGDYGRPLFPQNHPNASLSDRFQTLPLANVFRSPKDKEDQLSRPILTNILSEVVAGYYTQFCEILGKIALICEGAFGSQTVLDEKSSTPIPKTPLSESLSFARRDDHQGFIENKQAFYELLNSIMQVLPRFRPANMPTSSLITLLCSGTAHIQDNVAESSATSLKYIARQSQAQQVTTSYSRLIFSFDDKYSIMSEGGLLGSGQIEDTLQLYLELLEIWVEEIRLKAKEQVMCAFEDDNDEKRTNLDISGLSSNVDEIEAHALFFLCSQSCRVRALAMKLLQLITEFDTLLGTNCKRLIEVLEKDPGNIFEFNDNDISAKDSSGNKKGKRESNSEHTLIEVCCSGNSHDMTLWLRVFPNLIRICYEQCPLAVKITREVIGNRILQMYKSIVALSEATRGTQQGSFVRNELNSPRKPLRSSTTPPEVLIEQWKLYLIFNCTTLSDKDCYPGLSSPPTQHIKKGSKPNYAQEKITSARILFKYIVPLLSVESDSIRDSVVESLGSINISIYKILLEELRSVNKFNDDLKALIHHRATSNASKIRRAELLQTEVTHVYQLTAHFLKDPDVHHDEWILNNLITYTKDLKLFLTDGEVQANWEFQKLRRYYCGFMEKLFEGIKLTNDCSRWMTFEMRKSSLNLMEDWCGFSLNENQIRQREDSMRQFIIDQQPNGESSAITAALEIEKRNLKTAALSAMAVLCGGPLSLTIESRENLLFGIKKALTWINSSLRDENERMQFIGRKALKNLITHNQDIPSLLEYSIVSCSVEKYSKVFESYFEVVAQVLLENPNYLMPTWRILAICLFTLLSNSSEVRPMSIDLLQRLEEKHSQSSKLQYYKINVSDRTEAIYMPVQLEISTMLSKNYPEETLSLHSEFAAFFKYLTECSQRNILALFLPWSQHIKLQIDPTGRITDQSLAFLLNLCEITAETGKSLHNDVEAVWQSLVSGHDDDNLPIIVGFIISLCLDRREQNSVQFSKKIFVYLSTTPAGRQLVRLLLTNITPKAMIPDEESKLEIPTADDLKIPYIAEVDRIFPIDTRSTGLSSGQLSLIFLVDLVISPIQLIADNLPLLLHVIASLWIHYIPAIREHAKELLIHLVREFVIAKINHENFVSQKKDIEAFIESIKQYDSFMSWSDENQRSNTDELRDKIPPGMRQLVSTINESFRLTYPEIQKDWTKISLTWATSCPIKHFACRSLQVFRCIVTLLDHSMLADILQRLSNTISDQDPDVQKFSMEILTTLKCLISKLDNDELLKFPQLFWTICACLETVNEEEFQELLYMLEVFLNKIDLDNNDIRVIISEGRPAKWEGKWEGIQKLIYRGLRSSKSLDITLKMISRITQLPNDDITGDESRLMFAILANFPRLMHAMDRATIDNDNVANATLIANIAESQGHSNISRVLTRFASSQYRISEEFLVQLISAIKESFFPLWNFKGLVFLIGLLKNSLSWFKIMTFRILFAFISEIDMSKPEILSQSPDLILPLIPLLQTEYSKQALELLDRITLITSNPFDTQQNRMNITHLSSETTRKENIITQNLLGKPESTGWALPFTAKQTSITRGNIYTIFCSCLTVENITSEFRLAQEADFQNDDLQNSQMPEILENSLSDEGRGKGNIGELILKLDSLDGFFESCLQSPDSNSTSSGKGPNAGFPDEKYEPGILTDGEQMLPILHKSPSNLPSFEIGLPETSLLKANTMNPGAFYHASINRRSFHSRSATTPSAPISFQGQIRSDISDDEYNEVFSDGDDERHTNNVENSFFLENIIKPLPHSLRSSMRRLTSSRSRDIDRIRDSLRSENFSGSSRRGGGLSQPKSPKVPRVPSAYLQKMMGSG